MIINATIQVVPIAEYERAIPVIDKAIALIQNSGIKYNVGPFETSLEGEYEAVQALLRKVEDFCYAQKDFQFLVYSKLHISGGKDILEVEKTGKFKT